jgi:UDP-glucose 4-epimerase
LTTEKILSIGSKYNLKKIIYISSGAVYGEPKKRESYERDALDPNTLYGLTKKYAEECIRYYQENFKINSVILRFPNVYGEGAQKGVIANFLHDIEKYKKITVAGDGMQERNFLHVSDAVMAIKKILKYNKSNIFNISNPETFRIIDVANLLKQRYIFDIQYKASDNQLKRLSLNIDKARTELNFSPKYKKLFI